MERCKNYCSISGYCMKFSWFNLFVSICVYVCKYYVHLIGMIYSNYGVFNVFFQ